MPRVDVWDIPAESPEKQQAEPLWVGLTRAKIGDRYDIGKQLGQGGFGSVQVVIERGTGKEYACKSIVKRLSLPNVSVTKQNQHLENIRREALILRRLRGTLNVVHLEDVFEDEEAVHMVMEWCKGGELVHRINTRHYSERTAASYMRAVLRTLAQCHHLRILHRDIKPGNFMLLTDADNAPVKAIDFGLAVFFDPKKLPRTDLGLEGTPHFMAPEQLSGKTEPASDIWSAGVMAHQLLCGNVPFDDVRNPRAPALSLVWRAILTEEPRFTQRSWSGISELAKDFVRSLLRKDPKDRPTAKQALAHPWLQGKSDQRNQGAPLARTVVQRLQKFGVESALKRTVLDMIANDLINRHIEELKLQQQQQQQQQQGQQQQPSEPSFHAGISTATPMTAAAAAAPAAAAAASIDHTSGGPAGVDAGEATPQGAAAAAAAGSPLPQPPPPPAADAAAAIRLRQLAAQDLLLRSGGLAPKHATVHAGEEALAALRRGQLLGLPRPPSMCGIAPAPGAPLAAAAAAAVAGATGRIQVPYPPQNPPQRRSHDLGQKPPLLLSSGGAAAADGLYSRSATSLGLLNSQQLHQQDSTQQQQPQPQQPLQPSPTVAEQAAAGATAPAKPPSPQAPPLPMRYSGPAASQGPLAVGSSPLGMPRSPSWQRIARSAAAAAAAAAATGGPVAPAGALPPPNGDRSGSGSGNGAAGAVGGGGSSYKGPVKDLAAATAWDMGFMATRLAQEGGSGHALHHYARLLGSAGERSLHGVRERSYHAGLTPAVRPHSPTASPFLGGADGQAQAPSAAATGEGSNGGGGSSEYMRMLSLAARQRAEQRKVQRLSLDTSGHRQSHYGRLMAAEAAAEGTAAATTTERGAGAGAAADMAPPEEADEEGRDDETSADTASVSGGADGAGGGTLSNSAATTGAFSSPGPAGVPSAHVSAAALLPPSPTVSRRSPAPQRSPPSATAATAAHGDAARSPASAPPPAGPFTTTDTAAAATLASPSNRRPLAKPSIPGLEEADAVSLNNAIASTPAAATTGGGGGGQAGSDGGMSYTSGSVPGATDEGADSLAALREGDVEEEGMEEEGGGGGGGRQPGGAEEVKRSSLLRRVRKALLKPVKTLLGTSNNTNTNSPAAASAGRNLLGSAQRAASSSDGGRSGTATPTSSAGGIAAGARTPVARSGTLAKLSASIDQAAAAAAAAAASITGGGGGRAGAGGGARGLSTLSVSSVVLPTEERGRGRGAYAAFVQNAGTGTNTPLDRSAHGTATTDRSGHSERDRSVRNGRERSFASSEGGGAVPASAVPAAVIAAAPAATATTVTAPAAAAVPGPAGYAIHTVKAHRDPQAIAGTTTTAAVAAVAAAAAVPATTATGAGVGVAMRTSAAGFVEGNTAANGTTTVSAAAATTVAAEAPAETPAAAALTARASPSVMTAAATRADGGVEEGTKVEGKEGAALSAARVAAVYQPAAMEGVSTPAGATEVQAPTVAAVAVAAAATPEVAVTEARQVAEAAADGAAVLAAASALPRSSVRQDELAPALALLLGDAGKVEELQEVMRRLQYDRAEELTYEQLSEGLQWLGYRLEASEVADLLRQVSGGAQEGLTASQFIASQVDWRSFQANHRSQWLDCLRKAFAELGGGQGPGGRVTVEQLVAALSDKLPEEEVNLAVQDSLMDAAVETDAMDFDGFVRLMRCNSSDSLASGASSEMSYDLYDPRLKDASLHGPLGDGTHYQPALETVPDDQE
ncbi:hypothetical protein Agub_g336 [Astrephomene gubernaculifera]|uniref:Protein kinase domain-containing protein n=1 Tax=Astrephomene gubernaculifera TaxID=47775 RepID=A0AAD3DH06_9CHLO|nr:hypothetical protein Agub_g336 [Astrephomene gubernaculifera]